MRIDLHAHVLTPRFREALGLVADQLPAQEPELLRPFMESYGIDASVVSMIGGAAVTSSTVARTGNEELAELIRAEPAVFGALAVLPLIAEDPDIALEEIEYALDTLGLDGVQLFSHHGGAYLGNSAFDPVFAELDRRGAYAFVHPVAPRDGWPLEHPVWLYEFTFETTRALTNLIYSGTLERYPNVRLQFAHLGGTTPFLAHRIASLAERQPELATKAPAGALEYLRRQYFDTGLTNNTVALASTLRVTSLDHIVFGSDWPYLATRPGSDPSDDFENLDPADRRRIDAENAAVLVPRLAARVAERLATE